MAVMIAAVVVPGTAALGVSIDDLALATLAGELSVQDADFGRWRAEH